MNRPIHLVLTCFSLLTSAQHSHLNFLIFDQNSKGFTGLVLKFFQKIGFKLINSNTNVGMLEGWKALISNSKSETLLLVENDWFCDSNNSDCLLTAKKILLENPEIAFVKCRNLNDLDYYGKNDPTHQPWSVLEGSVPKNYSIESLISGERFYKINSKGTGFTFNPILIRRSVLEYLISDSKDELDDPTPLRSGENVLDRRWRANLSNFSAVIDGPFRHIGFHNLRNYVWPFPKYVLTLICRIARANR